MDLNQILIPFFSYANIFFKKNFVLLFQAQRKLLIRRLSIHWLAKKLVIWAIYLINLVFLTKVFELLKSCHHHDHLAPNSMRLKVSKKVLLVHLFHGAAKLQAVKLFHFSKIVHYFYVSYFHMKTAPPMNTFDFLKH